MVQVVAMYVDGVGIVREKQTRRSAGQFAQYARPRRCSVSQAACQNSWADTFSWSSTPCI